MVFVAKSFDAPAKIIFPLSFDPWKQGILGLGDIVIPGIFISLNMRSHIYNTPQLPHALTDRFDYHQDQVKNKRAAERDVDIHRPFPKPYASSGDVLSCQTLTLDTTTTC